MDAIEKIARRQRHLDALEARLARTANEWSTQDFVVYFSRLVRERGHTVPEFGFPANNAMKMMIDRMIVIWGDSYNGEVLRAYLDDWARRLLTTAKTEISLWYVANWFALATFAKQGIGKPESKVRIKRVEDDLVITFTRPDGSKKEILYEGSYSEISF